MHTKDLISHQRSERHIVKQICEYLPDVGIAVLTQTLIIEAISDPESRGVNGRRRRLARELGRRGRGEG